MEWNGEYRAAKKDRVGDGHMYQPMEVKTAALANSVAIALGKGKNGMGFSYRVGHNVSLF